MWHLPSHELKFTVSVVCATIIHGGLLLLPVPNSPIEPDADSIELTPDLRDDPEAIATIPLSQLTPASPQDTVPLGDQPTPASEPEELASPEPTPVPQSPPTPEPPPQTSQPPPTSQTPPADPDPDLKRLEPEPTPAPIPDPEKKIEPPPTPDAKDIAPDPEPEPPPEPGNQLMAGVPHLEGAEPGCYGSIDCYVVEGANVRAIANTLQQQLEDQGYELRLSYRDTGLRVYEVSRGNDPAQFLHIASDNAGRDTFYVLSGQQQTLEELRSP